MRVELHDVVLGYRRRPVIRAGHLVVAPGRGLGVYGPNGAGKTTLLRGIMGLLAPMQGTVAREGDVAPAYMPQHREMELHWPMSGFDAASLWASAKGRFGRLGMARRHAVLEKMRVLDVESLRDRPFARLSGGQQQRLLLAGLLATDPNLLVLDEPTDGLDTRSKRTLLSHLRTARESAAVVLVSHDIDDLLALCHEVALIHPAESEDGPASVEVVPIDQLPRHLVHVEASTGGTA
jgi:zinc/manganese transport system ATP-binding protein